MSKGLVYTSFAIIATLLLIMVFVSTTVSNNYTSEKKPFQIGEASNYLRNVESDLDRAHSIAARRSVSAAVNTIIESGNEFEDTEQALENGMIEGKINGTDLNGTVNSSLVAWKDRVKEIAAESGYNLSVEIRNTEFSSNNLEIQTDLSISIELYDSATLARFNNTPKYTNYVDMTGFEDTMLLLQTEQGYINQYSHCGFDQLAEKLTTGSQTQENTSTYGEATFSESASDAETKILVSSSLPNESTADDFTGIISTDTASNPDDYDETKYILGVSEISSIEEGEDLVLYDDDVWNSNIRKMLDRGCYLKSNGEKAGPGVLQRMKNRLTAQNDSGLLTLLDKPELPSSLQFVDRSNVGYVYFNQSGDYGSLNKIAGLTGDRSEGNRDYRNGFRLDQYHIDKWNLTGLAYE